MNQSTVTHTEIGLRLTICSEFLLNEQKPIEEVYRRWMRKIGGRLIGFTEFEYWYDRFKNNQFDLGYDTSQDSKESSEIKNTVVTEANEQKDASKMTMGKEAPVKVVETQTEDLKSDHQFEEENVPETSQDHGENADLGIPNAIQISNDDRSETSNDANIVDIDLAYDTSLDSKEISKNQNTMDPRASGVENNQAAVTKTKGEVEAGASGTKNDSAIVMKKKKSKKAVKRKLADLKFNYQFKEEYVPETFQTLINEQSEKLSKIGIYFNEQKCTIKLDKIRIRLKKKGNDWMISYKHTDTTIRTCNPEKSIINHLWFVLRNPDIKLERFGIYHHRNPELKLHCSQKLDFEEINTLLQSMFDTFNHQINTSRLNCNRFDEDTFLSMLKHVKPGTLKKITFDIWWKEKGNYLKMMEIIELDQWKKAKQIYSPGKTLFQIDDFYRCENFRLRLNRVSLLDVLRVTERVLNSKSAKICKLKFKRKAFKIGSIIDFLQKRIDGSRITEIERTYFLDRFRLEIVNSAKYVILKRLQNIIIIYKH